MENFTFKIRIKILLSFILSSLFMNVYGGEGTKQTTPDVNHRASLCINNNEYGNFARYGSTNEQRLYIRIQNPNSEKVYLGFSKARRSAPDNSNSEVDSKFRILDPNGNVVFGSYNLTTSSSNITGTEAQKLSRAQNGPNGINGITTTGYVPIVFDPTGMPAGDYYIEFETNNNSYTELYYNYYDVTVANNSTKNSISGRLYSKRWALAMDDVSTDFNGAFFVFAPDNGSTTGAITQTGFVNKINFNGAGFRPWYFNVAFNNTGAGSTGNTANDQKSVWNAANATKMSPKYEVFLNDPDINVWKNGTYNGNIQINGITNCGIGESNINISVFKSGTIDILLDFNNGDGIYTPGTKDVLTTQSVTGSGAPPYAVSVPWNGKDGLGNTIAQGTSIPIVVSFGQAAFHFPMYDIEENQNGFSCTTVRPAAPSGYVLKLYWDDSNITYTGGVFSSKLNLTGCTPNNVPPGNCHTWNNFNSNNNGSPQYGNLNTINTWWYANRDFVTSNITLPPFYTVALGSKTNVTCFGGNDGKIQVNVTNGTAPFTYYINGGTTPNTLQALIAGTYNIKVVDANGCSATINGVVITQPTAALALAASSKTDVICYGKSTGSVNAGAISNSIGTITYSWKNALNVSVGTTASVSNLPAGTYTLTVTDNCSSQTNTVTIGQPSAALALAASSKTDVTCFGFSTGTVTAGLVTNSVGTVTYSWKNALNVSVGTTASVSNLPAGTYTLTVTDNCSTQTNSVIIGQPTAALALAASSKTDITCFGFSTGSVTAGTVTNNVGTVNYVWKNALDVSVGTTASVSNLPAGTYTLTVTDNCSSQTNTVIIGQPTAALALAASSKTDVICFGFSTGSVTAGLVTNSVGTVNYVWKNASNVSVGTTASVSNLPAGTYTLTVTDNCSTQTNSVIIGQPSAALALAASSKTDVTCFGFSTGSVTAGAVTNFVGTVTYNWKNASNVSVGTTASVSNLPAGTYTLTVTDNCSTQTNTVTISQPSAALALAASSKTDVTCFGFSTGSITAGAVTNNVGTVNYVWKNASNVSVGVTASVSNLPAGTYTLTVTDNCSTQTNSVIIGQPTAALALAASSKTDVTCFGFSTGSVTAGTVTNNVGTVTYSWKNASNVSVGTTASVSNLPAGTYTLTVTDNCSTQTNSVIIGQPSAALALTASSKTDITCFGFSTGSVTAGLVTNSVGTVNYVWKNASNVSVGTTASVSNLPAGTYNLTVTDNCSTQTNSVIIGQPSAALALAASSKTDVTCFGFSTGTVTAGAVTNFVGTVTYNWKNALNVSVGTTASVSNLPAGTYTLTVTDNCSTQTNSVIIGQPTAALALAASSKTDVTCFGFSTGTVTAGAVTNFVGTVTYNWKNASNVSVGTTASVSNLPAGTYTLTVTDNCSTQTNSVIIGQPSAALALATSSKTDVTCFGFSTGSVTAGLVTNSVGTINYNWKNALNVSVGTTASVSNLPAGTYTLTVTDNCSTQTNSVIIGQPSAALALAASSKTDVTCFGFSTGSLTAGAVTNFVGTVTYSWKNALNVSVGTTASVSNLPAGTYTLIVTDNCSTQTNSVIIGQPSAALALAASSKTDVTCFGFSTGSVTAGTVTNNVGTVTYSWKNALNVSVGTTASVSNLPAGTYTLIITDNCSSQTNSVIIGQPSSALALAASSKTDVTCFGFSTGSIMAGAVTNSVGTVNYIWKNSSNVSVGTTASVSNLPAGTYTLTVTDNCSTQTNSVIIGQPTAALALAASSKTDVTCFGFSTGSVTAGAVTNFVGTVTYSWKNASNVSVGTTASVSNLPAGTYTLTVTDNCSTQTNSVIIGQPSAALALAASSKTDVTCFGFSTGTVTAGAVTNNVGTVTYNWKNALNVSVGTTASVSNLPAGTYTLTVTDNCSTQTNFVIIGQPSAALSAITSQINVGCGGGNNGSASVTVSGGTLGYTYSWDTTPVQTSATATGLIAGTYTVTIKDANLCTISKSVTITDGDAVKPIIDPLPLASTINCPALPVFATATATDNNGTVSSLTYDDVVIQGSCAGSYTTTRTWTAVDACGNISLPVSQVINVQDITAPTWSTTVASLNKTIECSDAAALTSAQAFFPIASDLCDSDVSDIVKVSGAFVASADCSNAGTYTNTWTVKDDCGNTSDTFTQVITIQDTSAPTWSTVVSSLNKAIECSDAATLTSAQALFPIASDLCDSDVSDIVKVSGAFVASADCSNAGTYTNTWTVKDDCGNTSDTFTQVITIQDTSAPTWSTSLASLNKTIECSDAAALTSAQALFPIASDLCDSDVSDIVKVSGAFVASADCSNAGTYTNTWTVKDDCGNTSDTFTQVITIQDTSAPTWSTSLASLNKTIECSDAAALTSAQALFPIASDLCDSDVSDIVKVSGAFVASADCSNAGTYTNTWTVKDDCGNTSDTFTQVITIQDTTKPTFIGELPTDITVSCDAVPEPANVEASDNCNGNLPIVFTEIKSDIVNGCSTNYTLTRTWTTSDCGLNTASYTQIITVRDTTPPTGTAPVDVANLQTIADIPVGNPGDIKDAVDNCSSTVDITVSDSNNGGSGCDGNAYILTRTYTLTDCAGNKTELKQTFTVENKVSVTGVVSNVTCFGGKDGLILVTNSSGSTVVIRNENNEVVGNTNLPAGTYTLTATSPVNSGSETCSATATVVISQPTYTVKISGQIINKDTNTPLANVPVTLVPQGTTAGPILLRITGADGLYNFSGIVAGSYLVQVQDANLNSAYQLYPIDSSLFFTTLEDCKIQEHNFEYGKSTLPVLGDYVWYDTNGNGVQDEWYDANNDGIVTKNIPDGNGAIDYSQWEWIDLNGDGSYAGPSNVGELNAGGFGNALSANVIIDGPNGYHQEVIVGIEGFWRDRPDSANPYGDYTIKLVKDANLDAVAANLGAMGLVKVLPSITDKKTTNKTGKSQLHTVCSTTGGASGYIVTITPEDLVHLDADFGVNCKVFSDIVANDDSAGPIAGVNHITKNVLNVLPNDTLEGVVVTASDVIITTVTPNEFLQLNADGSVDVLANAPVGTLTLVYQICEADQTTNCDTATVTVTIEAPVMTVTATPICVNDVPYIDYVVTPVNFTPVNGVTIAWANSNNTVITTMNDLPLIGRVLWPGAVVDQTGKGIDWPGWVFQNNKWIEAPDGFETLRPLAKLTISTNPSETITVEYPKSEPYCTARPTFAIVANDDNAGPINGTTASINVINVYNNDTLNAAAINPADVTLTIVTPDPKGALTLNPDGSVDVAAGTPGGTYTLTYQICENADAGNCDTAIVTVIVSEPAAPPTPVVANDDVYTNIGCNTFGLVGNVLINDFKGITRASFELVNFTLLNSNNNAKTDPNITFDALGNVTVSSLTPAGTYTYNYQICDKLSADNCDTATVTITVVPNGIVNISSQACNDDSTLIDLLALLPENTPLTGVWIDPNNSNTIQGNTFNALGLALGNYTFEYKITDQNCPRSILLNMEINDDCKVLACGNVVVHNAFSPNGDGINDVFRIDSIDDITCYPENNVEIYNRWGILVFETDNYNNTTNAFDGISRGRTTVKQSDGLPTGTYFYIINYKSLDGNNVLQNNKKDGYLYLSK